MKRLRSIRLRGEVFQQIADGWQTQLRFPTDGERPWDVAADGGRFQVSARISRETHRMVLRVVSLRTERLQDISDTDIRSSGVDYNSTLFPRDEFASAWDRSLPASKRYHAIWDENPLVTVVAFEKDGE